MNFQQLKKMAITENWDKVYIAWVTDKVAKESNKRKDSQCESKLRKWSSLVPFYCCYSVERLGTPRTTFNGALLED